MAGFSALLLFAIVRLTVIARAGFELPWQPLHWVALALSVTGMAYFEGYRAFQRSYAPRFAARAAVLLREPTVVRLALAPLFCMSFFDAPRRRVIAAAVLTSGIVALILTIRTLPQPWRGIIDAGVVTGLVWGLVVTLFAVGRVLAGQRPAVDPDIA